MQMRNLHSRWNFEKHLRYNEELGTAVNFPVVFSHRPLHTYGSLLCIAGLDLARIVGLWSVYGS